MKKSGTVWMIGASSGLGWATAQAFAQAGWLVVAGARSFAAPQGEAPANLHRLPLDVQEEASCEAFVDSALAISQQVDVLCYTAAVLVLSPCEETGQSRYEQVMQTNFLGMTRLVAKAMPIMRAQGGGRIVLFSSLNGVIGVPFQSAYTASKHAMEGYAQCLAMEGRPFGISVCVVEPGDHRGGSQAYRFDGNGADRRFAYDKEFASACRTIHRDEAGGLSQEALGRKVLRNASRTRMRFRLRVARLDQRAACWLYRLLPAGLFFTIMRGYYVKK